MRSRALSGTRLSETVSAELSPTLRQARHPALNGLGSGTGAPSGGVSDEGSGFGFVAESSGINLWSEYGLHAQLKLWAGARAGTADGAPRYEVPVHGRVVDLVLPDGEIVEIQGSGFGAFQGKALFLARAGFRLRIVYPAIAASIVVRLDPGTGEVVSRRASPKKRDFWSIFDQMVHAPALASTPGIAVEILSVEVEDIRMRDGAGSWRRKGDSLLDRRLKTVGASRVMASSADWLALLPGAESEWTSESLARGIGVPASTAQKILYTFAKAGYLRESGKEGRFKSYRRT